METLLLLLATLAILNGGWDCQTQKGPHSLSSGFLYTVENPILAYNIETQTHLSNVQPYCQS